MGKQYSFRVLAYKFLSVIIRRFFCLNIKDESRLPYILSKRQVFGPVSYQYTLNI